MTARSANAGTTGAAASGTTRPGDYADVNGLHMYYEIHGQGRPLVLLHGGLGAIEMFSDNVSALAAGRQVIAVDLQAHGRTADIDRPLSPEFMADDIAALVRHFGLERADIMGYSFGGVIALQTAIRHPDVVGRLIAVSAPFARRGYYPEMIAQQAFVGAAAAEPMKQTPMYHLYSAVAPRPEDWPTFLEKMGTAIRTEYDYSAQIGGITAQTLIVAGDADIFPPSHAMELFGLLGGGKRDGGWDGSGRPRSSLAILPGLTHYNIVGDPVLAATAIRFLDGPVMT